MIPILAAMVDITGNDQGGHVLIDPPVAIGALYLFLLLLPLLLVLAIVYYRSKFRHQQILAAMEKGVPVSEFLARPGTSINWIRNLSAGIGLLFIGVVLAVFMLLTKADPPMLMIPIVIGGLGLIFLLRGILQKKAEQGQTKN